MTQPIPSNSFITQLQKVEQLISKGELQVAATSLNALAKVAPRDPRLFLLGSLLAERSNNPQGALVSARNALTLAPDWASALVRLTEVLASQGQFDEALTHAQHAVALNGNDAELLGRVAGIAHRARQYDLANDWLQKLAQLAPDNVQVTYQIGRNLAFKGDHPGAVDVFTALLTRHPDQAEARFARATSLLETQQREQALSDLELLVSQYPDNETYSFFKAVASGETPDKQPAHVIRSLFDNMATGFDQHAVKTLQYTLPEQVAKMVHAWYGSETFNVLDLGCGTGLLGGCLGKIKGALVGVDLSEGMVQQAARHGVYDRFHLVDLVDALVHTPANLYHVIAALDALIYVGDLAPVISNAHKVLVPGGRLVISCEKGRSNGPNFKLHPTLRYTHRADYVQRLLSKAGFIDIELQEIILRHEDGQPVRGFLACGRKAT